MAKWGRPSFFDQGVRNWCALLAPEQAARSQPQPKIQFLPRATSTKAVLPLLIPTPVAVPGASLTAPKTIEYA